MKIKNKLIILFILLLVLLVTFFAVIPCYTVLSINNRKNATEYYLSKNGYKNGFIISYTHSVNKGRVHDYYECLKDGTLFLDKTVFVSYGAGIPEPDETPGAIFTVTDAGYTISNLRRNVPRLVMAVGIIANHSVVFNNEHDFSTTKESEIFLTDLFAPQTSIILQTKRVTLINYIFHKINLK